LIELLVVISILGILIAIMLPSLSKARLRARKVACGANLHGLSTTLRTYLSQTADRYPHAAEMPSINVTLPALPAAVQPPAATPPPRLSSSSTATSAASTTSAPASHPESLRAPLSAPPPVPPVPPSSAPAPCAPPPPPS